MRIRMYFSEKQNITIRFCPTRTWLTQLWFTYGHERQIPQKSIYTQIHIFLKFNINVIQTQKSDSQTYSNILLLMDAQWLFYRLVLLQPSRLEGSNTSITNNYEGNRKLGEKSVDVSPKVFINTRSFFHSCVEPATPWHWKTELNWIFKWDLKELTFWKSQRLGQIWWSPIWRTHMNT